MRFFWSTILLFSIFFLTSFVSSTTKFKQSGTDKEKLDKLGFKGVNLSKAQKAHIDSLRKDTVSYGKIGVMYGDRPASDYNNAIADGVSLSGSDEEIEQQMVEYHKAKNVQTVKIILGVLALLLIIYFGFKKIKTRKKL